MAKITCKDNVASGWLYTLNNEATTKQTIKIATGTILPSGLLAKNDYFVIGVSDQLHDNDVNIQVDVKAGYSWDGASTPIMNGVDLLYPSLFHDALYQTLRMERVLNEYQRNKLRMLADTVFYNLCLECGVNKIRAKLLYQGLRLGGSSSAARDVNGDPRDAVVITLRDYPDLLNGG